MHAGCSPNVRALRLPPKVSKELACRQEGQPSHSTRSELEARTGCTCALPDLLARRLAAQQGQGGRGAELCGFHLGPAAHYQECYRQFDRRRSELGLAALRRLALSVIG